jgi:hypothetical protein
MQEGKLPSEPASGQAAMTDACPWTADQMRLMAGEMTAAEIRAVRAFAPLIVAAAAPGIRKAAMEEAARECDWYSERQHPEGTPEEVAFSYSYGARDCSIAILALSEQGFTKAEK